MQEILSFTDTLANANSLLKERARELGLKEKRKVPHVHTLSLGVPVPKLVKHSSAEIRRLVSDLSSAKELCSKILKRWDENIEYLEYEVESTILGEGLEKLPDELIAIIFEHASHSFGEEDRGRFSFSLSCVSRRFRSISLGCAALWSYIHIEDKVCMIPTMLERSRDHPLYVKVGPRKTFWRVSGMERAQERIQTLNIIMRPLEEIGLVYKTSTLGTQRCFDNLRTIQLTFCEIRALYSLFQAMAHGLLPSLTSISFHNPCRGSGPIIDPHASLNSNPIIRLKTLAASLSDGNERPTYWKEVMTAFRFPDLYQLNIRYIGEASDRVIRRFLEDLEPERFDNLRSVEVTTWGPFTVNGSYLEALSRFPNLLHLSIYEVNKRLIYKPDLDNTIPRKLPQLAIITIRDISATEVSPLLDFARMLRRSIQWSTFESLHIIIVGSFKLWKLTDEGRHCMDEYKEILDGKVEFSISSEKN